MATKKAKKDVSFDIKDMAKELEELSTNPSFDMEEVKEAAKKTVTSAKSTAKKAAKETKKAVEKVTKETKKAVEKVAASAKKDIKRTAVVEYAGNQYLVEDVIARCEAKFKAESKKKAYKDIKVYIKPENNAAYYVVDEKSADKIDLI